MALTTPISSAWKRWVAPPASCGPASRWLGHEVPVGVTHIDDLYDPLDDVLYLIWRVKGDLNTHKMPFDRTEEGVLAALVAMKLTC